MTHEIIEMAREAGFKMENSAAMQAAKAFYKLVAAKEREACAKICDSFQARDVGMQPAECAGAIRARGDYSKALSSKNVSKY
jgi:hypothetical protein